MKKLVIQSTPRGLPVWDVRRIHTDRDGYSVLMWRGSEDEWDDAMNTHYFSMMVLYGVFLAGRKTLLREGSDSGLRDITGVMFVWDLEWE